MRLHRSAVILTIRFLASDAHSQRTALIRFSSYFHSTAGRDRTLGCVHRAGRKSCGTDFWTRETHARSKIATSQRAPTAPQLPPEEFCPANSQSSSSLTWEGKEASVTGPPMRMNDAASSRTAPRAAPTRLEQQSHQTSSEQTNVIVCTSGESTIARILRRSRIRSRMPGPEHGEQARGLAQEQDERSTLGESDS